MERIPILFGICQADVPADCSAEICRGLEHPDAGQGRYGLYFPAPQPKKRTCRSRNKMTDEAKIFHIQEIPWVDLGGGHLDKAMVTEPGTGMIVNVSFYPRGYTMGWHRHSCAHGMYIMEGSVQPILRLWQTHRSIRSQPGMSARR